MSDSDYNELRDRLDEQFQKLLKRKQLGQVVASAESMDGSFRWAAAGPGEAAATRSGDAAAPGAPHQATTESPFWIASITKLFIAATILRLQEQGRLNIEDLISSHLPQALTVGVEYADQMRVRHLLSHSSGLPDFIEIVPKDGKSLFEQVLERGDMGWTVAELMKIVRESGKPHFPPQTAGAKRTKVRYSDTNFQLLIATIEQITGMSFGAACAEFICRPLGLTRTWHPAEQAPRFPSGSAGPVDAPVFYNGRVLEIPLAMASFHDLYSTTGDLIRFMRALMQGQLFEKPETLRLMTGDWNQFGFMLSPIAPGWPIEYGMGMMRFKIPRLFSPFGAVPELIGHTGASGSWLFYCPPLKLIFAGTVNAVGAGAVPFRFVPAVLHGFRTPQK